MCPAATTEDRPFEDGSCVTHWNGARGVRESHRMFEPTGLKTRSCYTVAIVGLTDGSAYDTSSTHTVNWRSS
jgi:hypothetical protein